jgi:hypothetical protein
MGNSMGFYVSMFRVAGVDILQHSGCKLHNIYALVVTPFIYVNILAIIADVYFADELPHMMENARAIVGMTSALWMQNYVRYVVRRQTYYSYGTALT